jgi:RNA polymerase sigma-70 factor, ECF subfamily
MTAPHSPPESPAPLRYTQLAPLSDEALMAHLQAGRQDALAVLFDRYHRLVLGVALRILRDSGEAEDLMQAVFLEIFQSAAHFDPAKGSTRVWLMQYAYHRSFNRRQYLAHRGIYEHLDEIPEEKYPAAVSSNALSVQESARLVQQALGHLTKMQRKILEMAFYEGLTMREIAQRTGESFFSVRHFYYRGLEKLRSMLCDDETRLRTTSAARKEVPDA